MPTVDDYKYRKDAVCAKIGDIDVALLDVCQITRIMDENMRHIAESNLEKLKELGASAIDRRVDSISDLNRKDLAESASVFIFHDNHGGKSAAVRLDMDDDLSKAYASLLDYAVLDEALYSQISSNYLDENRNDICGEVLHNLFREKPCLRNALDEKGIHPVNVLSNDETWKYLVFCAGIDGDGWFIDDMQDALRIAELAIEDVLDDQPSVSPY